MHRQPSYKWSVSSTGIYTSGSPGATVTPGQNTKGSWVDLLDYTVVTQDVYHLRLNVNSVAVGGQNRSCLVDVGIKPNGGAYTVLVAELNCSRAPYGNSYFQAGIEWELPIKVPANHTIGVRSSVNNATVGTHKAWVKAFGLPTLPHYVSSGSYSETFGTVAGESRGTEVIAFDNEYNTLSGYGSTYTQIGTTTKDLNSWIMALGRNATTDSDQMISASLYFGDGTTKIPLITDAVWTSNLYTFMICFSRGSQMSRTVPSGSNIYAQLAVPVQPNNVPYNVSAYGFGGV